MPQTFFDVPPPPENVGVEVIPTAGTSARADLEAGKRIRHGLKNRLFGGAADASL